MDIIGIKETDEQKIREAINTIFLSDEVNFKLIPNLSFNKGWSVVILQSTSSDYPVVELSDDIIDNLSTALETIVIGYQNNDVISYHKITTYDKGKFLDEFEYLDFEVESSFGFFSDKTDEIENPEDFLTEYFSQLGFDPQSAEVLDEL